MSARAKASASGFRVVWKVLKSRSVRCSPSLVLVHACSVEGEVRTEAKATRHLLRANIWVLGLRSSVPRLLAISLRLKVATDLPQLLDDVPPECRQDWQLKKPRFCPSPSRGSRRLAALASVWRAATANLGDDHLPWVIRVHAEYRKRGRSGGRSGSR